MTETIVQLDVDDIQPSPFNPRKHLGDLTELAASMRQVGMLEPAVVRKINGGSPELVFGHRRLAAAKLADLDAIPCIVRDYSDDEVIEAQIIENGQRTDIHPLDEADGYQVLLERGKSATQIADKIGRPVRHVLERLQLQQLSSPARKALDAQEITLGLALLLARIPSTKLQAEALGRFAGDDHRGPSSTKHALTVIREQYMLQLGSAPFDRADTELVPAAGACTVCVKRTGNQAELFSDVKSPDLCTDPVCFRGKLDAHAERALSAAKAEGRKVLSSTQAKREVFTGYNGEIGYDAKYADLKGNKTDYSTGRSVSVRSLLGDAAPEPVIAVNPLTGRVHELVPAALVDKALKSRKAKAVAKNRTPSKKPSAADQAKRAAEALKAKAQDRTDALCIEAAVAEVEKRGSKADLLLFRLLLDLVVDLGYQSAARAAERRGIELKKHESAPIALSKLADKLTEPQLRALLLELVLGEHLDGYSVHSEGLTALKQLGVDRAAIEKRVLAELKAAEAKQPAPKPEPKASTKRAKRSKRA